MVRFLFTFLLLGAPNAVADVNYSGLSLQNVEIKALHNTNINLNFAIIDGLAIKDCKLLKLEGFQLSAQRFRVSNITVKQSDFSASDLSGSVWQQSSLPEVRFNDADLSGAQFSFSHLEGCNLRGADLRGTRFWGTSLAGCDFRDALFDDSTVLPFSASAAEDLGMIHVP